MSADTYQVGGSHYKDMPEQPWDAMLRLYGREAFIGFLRCTILKYEMRDGKKPGALDDAKKAAHCRVKLEEVLDDQSRAWT